MHELGIVMQVISTVEEAARDNSAHKVTSVALDYGSSIGIIPTYMQECWKMAVLDRPLLSSSELVLRKADEVSVSTQCCIREITVE